MTTTTNKWLQMPIMKRNLKSLTTKITTDIHKEVKKKKQISNMFIKLINKLLSTKDRLK